MSTPSNKNHKQESESSDAQSSANQRPTRSCVPYNPDLHQLVEGKQASAQQLDPAGLAKGFKGWHQRGYLPHRDVPGVAQFVTFRLRDAMPASRRSEWEAILKIENNRDRRTELEAYLDQGMGNCWLRNDKIAKLTEASLRFFDGQQFMLRAWVIMPNHVHVLMDIWKTPLAMILKRVKGFTAREANKLIGRKGTFWEREYWDTVIKDEAHLRKAVRYFENNPVKAGMAREANDWPWSSARFRDEYGKLRVPMPER